MWEFWRGALNKRPLRRKSSDTDSQRSSASDKDVFARNLPGTSPQGATHIYFKDLKLPALDDSDDDDVVKRVNKQKLVIILVGLPGRGKTFLCNKLMCYLNWLGHHTRHFNVGQYRRLQKSAEEFQDAGFFDKSNPEGLKARQKAVEAALLDMLSWLETDLAQVAIFDATNSTEQRREFLRSYIHGRFEYLFIESICNDMEVLQQNYKHKMMYSPDYVGDNAEHALKDFEERIHKYEEVYDTITNRDIHYIKLIDMVTGRGYMDVNRISGYIPGKIVFYLMQVCKVGIGRARRIWLTRHGESEWNLLGKLGGNSKLSQKGKLYSQLLPEIILPRVPKTEDGSLMPVSVWTSTLKRTHQTAQHLPFPKLRWKVLDEIHAGVCDGMTYAEIAEAMPEEFDARKKDKLKYRYPSGESYMDVIQRLEAVVTEIERERECVCIVAHQAVLRAIYGYFIKAPLESIPRLEVPLHTVIELTPMPDGTMLEERFPINEELEECMTMLSPMSSKASSSSNLPGLGGTFPMSYNDLRKLAVDQPSPSRTDSMDLKDYVPQVPSESSIMSLEGPHRLGRMSPAGVNADGEMGAGGVADWGMFSDGGVSQRGEYVGSFGVLRRGSTNSVDSRDGVLPEIGGLQWLRHGVLNSKASDQLPPMISVNWGLAGHQRRTSENSSKLFRFASDPIPEPETPTMANEVHGDRGDSPEDGETVVTGGEGEEVDGETPETPETSISGLMESREMVRMPSLLDGIANTAPNGVVSKGGEKVTTDGAA